MRPAVRLQFQELVPALALAFAALACSGTVGGGPSPGGGGATSTGSAGNSGAGTAGSSQGGAGPGAGGSITTGTAVRAGVEAARDDLAALLDGFRMATSRKHAFV